MSKVARDAILNRIRQALKSPSPEPHWLHEPVTAGPLFPLPERNEADLRERFRDEFVAIMGEWHAVDSLDAGRALLADWLNKHEITTAVAPDRPALRTFLRDTALVRWVNGSNPSSKGWESIDLGITTAECLVAESGTIVVSAGSSGRAPSVLPPIHLVVATADQLVPDLESAIALLTERYPNGLPSSASFISGPSRTADIEKILVLGAHGPRRLVLLLLPAHSLDS